jgi:hypothetical protein
MFKAQIITNINGKQTVVEFDNQHEYQDYLKNHPDIQDQMNWTPTFPSWFANRTGLPRWSD